MRYLILTIGWVFTVFFALLTISMLLNSSWLQTVFLLVITLLCLPPLISFLRHEYSRFFHPFFHLGYIFFLLILFIWISLLNKATSIYKSPQIKTRLMEIYDNKMKAWPIGYRDLFINSRYGKIHVIDCGREEGEPLLLLHASGVSAWSWKYNVQDLSRYFRIYAIDLIGDAGKSEYNTLNYVMKTGKDQAELYCEIADSLSVEKTFVVGASEGGFIASNLAYYAPERVNKMVLLGPMGYSGAVQSIVRITMAQMFPLKFIHDSTFSWAFSDNADLKAEFEEWFPLMMRGIFPVKVAPLPLSADVRQHIDVPVLFIFGKKDNLVGDPEKARKLVQDVPNGSVKIINAGHLMAGEKPEEVNQLVLDFFHDQLH